MGLFRNFGVLGVLGGFRSCSRAQAGALLRVEALGALECRVNLLRLNPSLSSGLLEDTA